MENGAFAPKEQMLHFPYFQIHDISKASKGVIMEYRVNCNHPRTAMQTNFSILNGFNPSYSDGFFHT